MKTGEKTGWRNEEKPTRWVRGNGIVLRINDATFRVIRTCQSIGERIDTHYQIALIISEDLARCLTRVPSCYASTKVPRYPFSSFRGPFFL